MQTASFTERKKYCFECWNIVRLAGRQEDFLGNWCMFKNPEENNYYLVKVLVMTIIEGTVNERCILLK